MKKPGFPGFGFLLTVLMFTLMSVLADAQKITARNCGAACKLFWVLWGNGDPAGTRTQGNSIKSRVLYQLSYGITKLAVGPKPARTEP